MSNSKSRKLQYLIIKQLLEEGSVQLILPDGVKLDIGNIQEDKFGKSNKAEDYCYIVASRDGRTAMIDSYNIGIQYEVDKEIMLFEEEVPNYNGTMFKTFEVV